MPLDTYRKWKLKNAQVGCVFARLMAARPSEHGQRGDVIPGHDSDAIANAIAARIAEWVDDPVVQAASLVFPDLNDLEATARVALSLGGKPDWGVARTLLQGTPVGDVVAFNITRNVHAHGGALPSEALVLGPFVEFPATRRAPVTALELFVGAPPTHQRDGTLTTKGHLADIQIPFPTKAAFDTVWKQTQAARLRSLNGVNDLRAKAKVALTIPVALATSLGCLP